MKRFMIALLMIVIIFTMVGVAFAYGNLPLSQLLDGTWMTTCSAQTPNRILFYSVDHLATLALLNLPNTNAVYLIINKEQENLIGTIIMSTITYLTTVKKAKYISEYTAFNNDYVYSFDTYEIILMLGGNYFTIQVVKR